MGPPKAKLRKPRRCNRPDVEIFAPVELPAGASRRPTTSVFRIMKRHGLLLQRHTGRRKGRLHGSKVVVMRSNLRWCSDLFEITCWNGEIVRIVFVIDAHDRQALGWHAVAGASVSGSMVRDLMLEAVEIFTIPAAAADERRGRRSMS
jgi:transposase InsO family protein